MKDLRTGFCLSKQFEPHNFHVTDSLTVFHKLKDCFVFNAVVCSYRLWSVLCFLKRLFLHLLDDVLVGIYFILHFLLDLFIVIIV